MEYLGTQQMHIALEKRHKEGSVLLMHFSLGKQKDFILCHWSVSSCYLPWQQDGFLPFSKQCLQPFLSLVPGTLGLKPLAKLLEPALVQVLLDTFSSRTAALEKEICDVSRSVSHNSTVVFEGVV